jgi:hypothetical protein
MEIVKIKADHAYGFSDLLQNIAGKIGSQNKTKVSDEEWDLFKKPGFYKDRKIVVVGSLPKDMKDETIYVSFGRDSYEIKSGRNFIHGPAFDASDNSDHQNLVYFSARGTSYDTEDVLKDLRKLNNGIL